MPPSHNFALAKTVAEELDRCAAAWPGSRRDAAAPATHEVFCEALDGVSLDAIPAAGKKLRQTSKYFPSAAEFRAAALDVERVARDASATGYRYAHSDQTTERCPQCHGPYLPRGILGRLFCDCQWVLEVPHEARRAELRAKVAEEDAKRGRAFEPLPLAAVVAAVTGRTAHSEAAD